MCSLAGCLCALLCAGCLTCQNGGGVDSPLWSCQGGSALPVVSDEASALDPVLPKVGHALCLKGAQLLLKPCTALPKAAVRVDSENAGGCWEASHTCLSSAAAALSMQVRFEGSIRYAAGVSLHGRLADTSQSLYVVISIPASWASNWVFRTSSSWMYSPASLVSNTIPSQRNASSGACGMEGSFSKSAVPAVVLKASAHSGT